MADERRALDREPRRQAHRRAAWAGTVGCTRSVERGILLEDLLLEAAQGGAGIDAELLDEQVSDLLERLQSFGLPSAAVQPEHELAVPSLPERLLRHEGLEFGDELGVGSQLELGVDAILDRTEAQLLEASPFADRPGLVGQIGEGRSPPE